MPLDVGVAPLDLADLPDDLRRQLAPRVQRLGYLGDFFRYCGHQPDALLHFYLFTEALKDALPPDLTEAVALTVAAASGNDYERAQHERLARRLGFSDPWIAALAGSGHSPPGCPASNSAHVPSPWPCSTAIGTGPSRISPDWPHVSESGRPSAC